MSTGFNYVENYVRPFVNKKLSISKINSRYYNIIRHTLTIPKQETLYSIDIVINNECSILKYIPLSSTGDTIYSSPNSRIGIVFIKFNSKKSLLNGFNSIANGNVYKVS